eukprot:1371319-Pleurochrysis_carterae.AAC.1
MATDSVRALLLELAGYDVKVFEFIGGEHTAKNVMIAATRRQRPRPTAHIEEKRRQLRQQLELFGVRRQRLAEWLGELPKSPLEGTGARGGTPRRERRLPLAARAARRKFVRRDSAN